MIDPVSLKRRASDISSMLHASAPSRQAHLAAALGVTPARPAGGSRWLTVSDDRSNPVSLLAVPRSTRHHPFANAIRTASDRVDLCRLVSSAAHDLAYDRLGRKGFPIASQLARLPRQRIT